MDRIRRIAAILRRIARSVRAAIRSHRAVAALLGACVLLAIGVYAGWRSYGSPGPLAEPQTLIIARGSTPQDIAEQLGEAGVLRHPALFLIGLELDGRSGELKAGEYRFAANISPREVVDLLASGHTVRRKLTIPEGLSSAEIAALVNGTDGLTGDPAEPPAEGSLLPETYFFSYGDRRREMVLRMHRALARTLGELWQVRRPGLPLESAEEALVLASIVEKETAKPEERPRVAGVFLNRLRFGMRLQADPTVAFAVTEGRQAMERPLSRADLGRDSPFNTYLVKGLPPSPIAHPGKAAIRAVLQPAETDELYFVADGTGGHFFARSLAEHNRNVAKLRRITAQPGPPPASVPQASAPDQVATPGTPDQAPAEGSSR
jgi:UPF0755 protein